MSIGYYKPQFGPGWTWEWGPMFSLLFFSFFPWTQMDSFWELSSLTGHLYPTEGMQMKRFTGAEKEKFIINQTQENTHYTLRQGLRIRAVVGPAMSYRAGSENNPVPQARGWWGKCHSYLQTNLKQKTHMPNPAAMSINVAQWGKS